MLFNLLKKTEGPSVASLIASLAQGQSPAAFETKLAALPYSRLSEEEKADWHYAHGLGAFLRGDYAAAFKRYREGHQKFPHHPLLKFSLGQEYERRGDAPQAFRLWDSCMYPAVPGQTAYFQAWYAYLWDDAARAASYLAPLQSFYFTEQALDDRYAFQRGMPAFGQYWGMLAALAHLQKNDAIVRDFTERCMTAMPEIDFSSLTLWLECESRREFALYAEHVRNEIKEREAQQMPLGELPLQLALLDIQPLKTFEQAIEHLNGVMLAEPFASALQGPCLLAFAALARRFGRTEEEQTAREALLAQYKMLLPPEQANRLGLLDYQASLLKEYRQNRS